MTSQSHCGEDRLLTLSRSFTILLVLLVLSAALNAQQAELQLKSGSFAFPADFDQAAEISSASVDPAANTIFRYVWFEKIPDASAKQQLASKGVILRNYLPSRVFLVEMPANFNQTSLKRFGAGSIMEILPAAKMDPFLEPGQIPDWAITPEGRVKVRISFVQGYEAQGKVILSEMGMPGIPLSMEYGQPYMEYAIFPAEFNALAKMDIVHYIEPVPSAPIPDDDDARGLHRSNILDSDHASGLQYDGDGVAVALADDGPVGPHIDVTGRVDQTSAGTGTGSHGDMTVGIVMGAGNLNPRYRGHATGAFMYVYGISGYPHVNGAVTNLLTRGVHVTSTSYSQGCNAGYTTDTRQGDQQIRQNPTLVHVFSAGNSSSSNCSPAGSPWGTITGGYKQGKNVMTCGNLTSSGVLTSSSSRGPTADGRIKPDICANGTSQMSIAANNNYQVGGGTSAACPSIAGIFSQLIHAHRDLYGSSPESSLIKGAMLNTAEDLGNSGPDFTYGWGRVNAMRAFNLLDEGRYTSSTISDGGFNTHNITVPAGLEQLRVMVYWLDYEGDVAASKALVNDLNMQLNAPGGTTYNPWVLNEAFVASTLDDPAVRGIDAHNNMEQVTLENPVAGTYTVNVSGFAVPQGPQKYYILVEEVGSEITVTWPNGGEGFVPGETEKIRWDAYDESGTFTLEYSTNNGSSWNFISSVTGSQLYYDWSVPATVSGQALVRVTRGAESDASDNNFTIIDVPQNITVDGACPTTVDLSWDPVSGATGYIVYMLGAKYMDNVGTTSGTSFTVSGTNPVDEFWFSVSATGPGGISGRRANAINKAPGVVGCIVAEDVSLDAILSPGGESLLDCYNYSAVPVTAQVSIPGLNNVSSFTLSYQLDGGTILSTTLGPLAAGAVTTYTFPGTIDLSLPGDYDLQMWVSYALDENSFNDTIQNTYSTLSGTGTTVGVFTQSLESFSNCGTTSNCGTEVCPLGAGWINLENGTADNIDWRVDDGGTPSSLTGPSIDHNPGNSTGNYIYLEASGGCEGQLASLLSPCLDLTGLTGPTLSFWYHMFGINIGSLQVDVYDGTSYTENVIPMISGDQGDVWNEGIIDLTPWAGQTVNLRFRGITGSGFESDISLDDFSLFDLSAPPSTDFSADILSGCSGTVVSFTDLSANIPNSWSWSFNPPTVTYLAGTSASSQNPVVSMNALASYQVSLTASNAFGSDAEVKSAYIDINNGAILPIYEDFESFSLCAVTTNCGLTVCPLSNGWINLSNGADDDIDWRTDENGTVSVATGPSIDKNPGTTTGNYLYLETSGTCASQTGIVESPCFDLTSAVSPEFTFSYHMYGAAMGTLSVDICEAGTCTSDVFTISGDQGDQWYDQTIDLSAWVGSTVTIRVRGLSGSSFTSDIALDDFRIEDTGVCPAPTGLVASPSTTSVVVSWNPVVTAVNYNVQGRLSPSGAWRNRFLTLTSLSQGGLNSGTAYDWHVRAECADGSISAFSAINTFLTQDLKIAAPIELTVYPVPSSSEINIVLQSNRSQEVDYLITDALGRVIYSERIQLAIGSNNNAVNVASWSDGVYRLVIRSENISEDRMLSVQH